MKILFLTNIELFIIKLVDVLSDTERAEGGFGPTGNYIYIYFYRKEVYNSIINVYIPYWFIYRNMMSRY